MPRVCLFLFASALAGGCGLREPHRIDSVARSQPQVDLQVDMELDPNHQPASPHADRIGILLEDVPDTPGLENVLRLTDRVYCGGQPQGEPGFASLESLGVRTVLSVDGARPEVGMARKYGMRYVHIPIGYEGVSEFAGRALARLASEVEGPCYVHCHHGKHRGPVAAAVLCIAAGAADRRSARMILERAGTSKDYPGLWRDVEQYSVPGPGAELPELVEVAPVKSLTAAMAMIDRNFDLLQLCGDADWSVPADHPDLLPVQEAVQLREKLREAGRQLGAQYSPEFRQYLGAAEGVVQKLEHVLKVGDRAAATRLFGSLEQACARCHAAFRDKPIAQQ